MSDHQPTDDYLAQVYDELRRLAAQKLARERVGQTLQPTALVHEAYLRLVLATSEAAWENNAHFFAAAAEAMRRILVDNARKKACPKHGGDRQRVELDDNHAGAAPPTDDILAVNEALEKLAGEDAQLAKLVELKYFAGFTLDEAAKVLEISPRQADRLWAYARAWLHQELHGNGDS